MFLEAAAKRGDVPGGLCFSSLGNHFPINRSGNVENPNVDRAIARDRFPYHPVPLAKPVRQNTLMLCSPWDSVLKRLTALFGFPFLAIPRKRQYAFCRVSRKKISTKGNHKGLP